MDYLKTLVVKKVSSKWTQIHPVHILLGEIGLMLVGPITKKILIGEKLAQWTFSSSLVTFNLKHNKDIHTK